MASYAIATASTYQELRESPIDHGATAITFGKDSLFDEPVKFWFQDSTSTETDNNNTVLNSIINAGAYLHSPQQTGSVSITDASTLSATARGLNKVFIPNENKYTIGFYTVQISSGELLTGTPGVISLQVSENGSTNWINVSDGGNLVSGITLLGFTDTDRIIVSGGIKPGWSARLITSGPTTMSYITGHEVYIS